MPNGRLGRLLENRRAVLDNFGENRGVNMANYERMMRARRAVFELEEVILSALIEAKIEGEREGKTPADYSLKPSEISARTGIFSKEGFGKHSSQIVYGVLSKLLFEGLIAKHTETSGGAKWGKAYLAIDVD